MAALDGDCFGDSGTKGAVSNLGIVNVRYIAGEKVAIFIEPLACVRPN